MIPAKFFILLLLISRNNSPRRIDHGAKPVLIEKVNQIGALTSLRPITRHQDIAFGHQAAQRLSHLRIRRPDNGPDITVRVAHAAFGPFGNLFPDPLIERPAVRNPILKLAARRVRRLHQHKNPLLFLSAHVQKRLYAVRPQIRVHRRKILVKRRVFLLPHLHLSQMPRGISGGSRADIAALYIADHNQILFVAVIHRPPEHRKPRQPKLLVHGNLRLHRRNQIIHGVHNRLIKLPDRLGSPF